MKRIFLVTLMALIYLTASGQSSNEKAGSSQQVIAAKRYTSIPDFTKYTDVKQKKKAFFDFLRPMVKEENDKLMVMREKLLSIYASFKADGRISAQEKAWLEKNAEKFRAGKFDINNKADRDRLLGHVDIVPEALFLAQAANESAWGTSRFARTANNLFGQWCFTKGCGIVPSQRGSGETHEVQKFVTINDAVASYVRNLNSHPAYLKLRTERTALRIQGKTPTGHALAIGLEKYSARGVEYVKEIRSMISYNKLEASLEE